MSLSSIQAANSYTIALLCSALASRDIPSLAYGIAALQCYDVELCVIDIEITVRDSDIESIRAFFLSSGLSPVGEEPPPMRDQYGRPGKDVLYFEPPSSASAARGDTMRKVYVVVYPASTTLLDLDADVAAADHQRPSFFPQGVEPDATLEYRIPAILALRRSFLHRFLTCNSVEERAHVEMLLAYLHRELRKPAMEELLYDVPENLKPCLQLVLRGDVGYDETEQLKEEYRKGAQADGLS